MELKLGILAGIVILIAILLMSNNVEPSWDGKRSSITNCNPSDCKTLNYLKKCGTTDDYLATKDGINFYTMKYDSRQYNNEKNLPNLRQGSKYSICKIGNNLCKNSNACYASCGKFNKKCPSGKKVSTSKRCSGPKPSDCTATDCCSPTPTPPPSPGTPDDEDEDEDEDDPGENILENCKEWSKMQGNKCGRNKKLRNNRSCGPKGKLCNKNYCCKSNN